MCHNIVGWPWVYDIQYIQGAGEVPGSSRIRLLEDRASRDSPLLPPGGIQVLFWVSVGYGRVVDSGQRAQLSRISRMCPHIDYFRYLSSKAQGNHHSKQKIFSSEN